MGWIAELVEGLDPPAEPGDPYKKRKKKAAEPEQAKCKMAA